MTTEYKLALLGFGNVGQALARLLLSKENTLQEKHGLSFRVVGIATGSHGTAVNPRGLDLETALSTYQSGSSLAGISTTRVENSLALLASCGADVLFESTPVDYRTGQPALDYLRAGLENDMHVITANKGPLVHGYRQLRDLARERDRAFLFESTVMDGAPVFSMARSGMPAADIIRLHGILNSTTNFTLGKMEAGQTLDEAIRQAQRLGIAETDPSGDVDGWDAAVKVAALVTVLMNYPLKPDEVDRTGIRDLTENDIEMARREGKRWKLVCSANRTDTGIEARVAPQMVSRDSPLYRVSGTSAILQIESDVLGKLTLGEEDPSPLTTAYGMLADFLNAARG